MDFIEGLPKSHRYSLLFVVVDRLSKYAYFIPLSHPYTATTVAQAFMTNIFRLHGLPKSFVSDRDTTFTSAFWRELFKAQGTKLTYSTTYHPQTDGQTEIVNKCVEGYLQCFVSDKPKEWVMWVPLAEWWYNTNYHCSTKFTPFEVVYGTQPPRLLPYELGTTKVAAVDETLHTREQMLVLLKENMHKAQNHMRKYADLNRSERKFTVGDWVYLRLQPYRQLIVAKFEAFTEVLWTLLDHREDW